MINKLSLFLILTTLLILTASAFIFFDRETPKLPITVQLTIASTTTSPSSRTEKFPTPTLLKNSTNTPVVQETTKSSIPWHPIRKYIAFGEEEVRIGSSTYIGSGYIGSNDYVWIGEKVILGGSSVDGGYIFSNRVHVGKNSTVMAGIGFNNLEVAEGVSIGDRFTPISIPLNIIPDLPIFSSGDKDLIISRNIAVPPGSYKLLEIKPGVKATFVSGSYNLERLNIGDNAVVVFAPPVTINVAKEIIIGHRVIEVVAKDLNLPDINVNFSGTEPAMIGSWTALALDYSGPNAELRTGDDVELLGSYWAKRIVIGENSILSLKTWFGKPGNPEYKIEHEATRSFDYVNELTVNFSEHATREDADRIARFINGKVISFEPSTNFYSFEILARSLEEVDAVIEEIKLFNDSAVDGVYRSGGVHLRPFVP